MLNYYPLHTYQQTTVVLDQTSGEPDTISTPLFDAFGNRTATVEIYQMENAGPQYSEPGTENVVLRTTSSSLQIDRESGLREGYEALGDALGEMAGLDSEDEWKVDGPVYSVACYVAARLMENSFPTPRLFSHGPKSVVFNWSKETDNLYLTVSADRISALISSPDSIKKRLEYSASEFLNPSITLSSVKAAFSGEPVRRLVSGAVADPPESLFED